MAGDITEFGSGHILSCIFGRTQTPVVSYWVALCAQAPSLDTSGSELTEPSTLLGYARQQVSNDNTAWGQPVGGIVATIVPIVWSVAINDWPVITHYALCTGVTGGDVYMFGELQLPRRIMAGHVCRFNPQLLSISVTGIRIPQVIPF